MACIVGASALLTGCSGAGSETSPPPVRPTTTVPVAAPSSSVVGGDPLTLKTQQGVVHGTSVGSTRAFLGVPFAAPPVGNLRWTAPQPAASWTGVRQVTHLSEPCPQIVPIVNSYEGSEDCLYANVYVPATVPARALPVMVWIYGGGFTVGSSGDDSVANFAASHDVVAVSFNYRLGPLGFLALASLRAEDAHGSTGNLGLLDQQAALRWVHQTIASYGGDPSQVTIFGESAGGISVCAQLVSFGATGLFQRAITESGPCTLPAQPLASAESQGIELENKLGCHPQSGPGGAAAALACIRTKSAQQVIEALPPDPSFLFGSGGSWGPVADGVTVPYNAQADLAAGRFHHVPVIVGANSDEGRLFVGLWRDEVGSPLTAAQWPGAVTSYFGPTVGAKVMAAYPLSAYPDPGAALGQAVGDAVLACPAVASAALLARYVPVYEYEYEHAPNPFVLPMTGIVLGASHSMELPYVFQGPVESSGNFTFTPAESTLADQVSGAWSRFAVTGSPSGSGLSWPRLVGKGGSYEVFDTPTSVATNMKAHECAFWASTGWTPADRGH